MSSTTIIPDSGTTTRLATTLSSLARLAGGSVRLLAFESPSLLRSSAGRRQRARALAEAGIRVRYWPTLPKRLPMARTLGAACSAVRILASARDRDLIVVALNSDAASACALAERIGARMNLRVFEWHGIESEEAILGGSLVRGTPSHVDRLRQESRALRWADAVVLPSLDTQQWASPLRPGPATWHELPTITDLMASPIAIQEARVTVRRELGWVDSLVVTYAGGMNPWQQPALMFDTFKALRERDPSARLLVLTGDRQRAGELVDEAGLDPNDVRVMSVPHHEVLIWLAAADLGLMLRQDHPVNTAASPTKFSEYLWAGVPVVLTDAVPASARIAEENAVGVTVPASATASEVASAVLSWTADRSAMEPRRERCRNVAAAFFTQAHADRVYARVLSTDWND